MSGVNMGSHGAEVVAILGTVGAATGAISAVLVYALCARRRRVPLNWFEKDLLDRVEEAEKSEENSLSASLNAGIKILRRQARRSESRSDDEWQPPDGMFNNRVREASKEVLRHLSECSCDDPSSLISPLAPPLPGGAVIATDERMVILKPLPRTDSPHSRLSSTESEDISCPCSANDTRGELQLSLTYDSAAGILNVKLIKARELRARELSKTFTNPYARIWLLPDRSNVWQTRVHGRTLDPVFDEDFVFEVQPNCSLVEQTLEVFLYDFDPFSRHRVIGYVQIPLYTVENLGPEPTIVTKSLRYGADGRFKSKELMVSMSYQPSAEKLSVIVIRAKNLPANDDVAKVNYEPYVQVNVIQEDKSLKKKKTGLRREYTSPVWSESLNFDIPPDVLSTCVIDFSVYRSNGELLATCEVSERRQRDLFHRVLSGKGASAQWLPLSEPEHNETPEQKVSQN